MDRQPERFPSAGEMRVSTCCFLVGALLAGMLLCHHSAAAEQKNSALQYTGTTVVWATEDENLRKTFIVFDVENRRIRVRPVPDDPSRGDFEITWDAPPAMIRQADTFSLHFGGRITATPRGGDGIAIEHRSAPAQLFEVVSTSAQSQYVGRTGGGQLMSGYTDIRVRPTAMLSAIQPGADIYIAYNVGLAQIQYRYQPVRDNNQPVPPGPEQPQRPPQPGGGGAMEQGMNRYGGDYRGFEMASPQPELCRDECARDPRCKAWTYVKPGTFLDPKAHCWLKDSIPEATPDSNCVSGVNSGSSGGTGTTPGTGTGIPDTGDIEMTMEAGWNYYGNDYRDMQLAEPRPELCRDECARDSRCLAYTYVKPGTFLDPNAHCWLKDAVSKPWEDGNCISGVKRNRSKFQR